MDVFEELRHKRKEYIDYDLSENEIAKLNGECKAGCRVKIFFCGEYEGIVDEGYVFVLDGMDADIGDCFIHIPEQDNSSGKDRGEPAWEYMIQLMTNDYVLRIECQQ